jgi:O-antigen/teichoic acid export membrane protein
MDVSYLCDFRPNQGNGTCAIIQLVFLNRESGVDCTRSSNLTRGASVMVASVTLAKLLGLIYIFPLTRLIHDEGIGIYSNAYSLYVILLTLSTAGFPTAMGKLVSEKLALRHYGEVEQIYKITTRMVIRLGILLFLVMWFGAPLYSHLVALRESKQAVASLTTSIRALAPALLVVPLMAAFRGYLQGFQRLEPSAYSQAIEQFVRVLAIVIGAYIVMKNGGSVAAGAAAATFGAFIGALAGLVLLAVAIVPVRRSFLSQAGKQRSPLTKQAALRALFRIALPVSLGALVVPISGLVDSLTVQNFLIFGGASFSAATAAYGVLSRQAMQLIQLPLAFAMAIGASVLPAIAHSKALHDHASIETKISGTIRSMLFMTFPVAAALLVLGRPLDQMLFGSTKGAIIISSVSFMSIFSSLELTSTYMLQGLDKMYRPVRNMFIGVAIKLLLNILLILPFHIVGAAVATTIGYLFSATLNVMAVKKYGNVKFSVWRLATPSMVATAVLCLTLWIGNDIGKWIASHLTHSLDLAASIQVVVALAAGAVVYVVASIRLRAVSASELSRLPVIGGRLSRLAQKIRPQRIA